MALGQSTVSRQGEFSKSSRVTTTMKLSARTVLHSCWFRIRQRRTRTIAAVLSMGVAIYLALTLLFAAVYLHSHSIADSEHCEVARFVDAFYFSFVSFMTIGYGDFSPINDFGKGILFLETVCSVLFNGIFPSILIYYALKRPESLLLSSRLLVTTNEDGQYILKLRIANRGGDLTNCQVVFSLFTFTKQGARLKPFTTTQAYPLLEANTTNVSAIPLEQQPNHVLLSELQTLFKSSNAKITIRINVTGVDADSGGLVALSHYYNRGTIVFGYAFLIVGFWNDDNISDPIWDNFNQIVPDSSSDINAFLRLARSPPVVE
jgi:hypothetical protein